MRIAVIEHAASGDYTEYILSLIENLAAENNYQLKTWSSSIPVTHQHIADNAVILISIDSNTPFILRWLYKIKIPSILKKIKANVVIDLNGIASDRIKIQQLIIAAPFLFNHNKAVLQKIETFAQKNLTDSLANAAKVLIYSAEKKNDFAGIEKEKLNNIFFSAPEIFKTYEWHDKLMVKAQHADNKEYFLAVIEDDNAEGFVLLMQAFSKFKKWQQSNMQLLILPKYEAFGAAIKERYKTYKFRDDVRLIEEIEEKQIAAIFASAYAFIHIATNFAQLFLISMALQCSLPVISPADDDVKEYCADAVLFSNEKSADALGAVLINIYKDENLHKQLAEAAGKRAANFNRKQIADKLWLLITNNNNKQQ